MPKKPGFTLEQHQAMGKRLKELYKDLNAVHSDVSNAYPGNPGEQAAIALEAVRQLRIALDYEICREIPGDNKLLRFYLGS